jgi:hypothetical protein
MRAALCAAPLGVERKVVVRAHADLAEAPADLENMPAFDPTSVGLTTHALSSYLSIARAGRSFRRADDR